jgi:uncharacterized protein Yka (UPF0111/DUF47 family)
MGKARSSLFGRSKHIERRIDQFLDKVSEAVFVAVATVHHQIDSGVDETVERRIKQAVELKRKCSELRREIEADLYSEMLIPDLLGDVASLIESLNQLVEALYHAMRFAYYAGLPLLWSEGAKPDSGSLRQAGKELATNVGASVDAVVSAARAFFRDFTQVRDHVHKVRIHESECDALRDGMLRRIFAAEGDLAVKNHVAAQVRELDAVADAAERISDALTIYAIKRSE